MPEIQIHSVNHEQLESLSLFEHGYYTEHAWQMSLDIHPEASKADFHRIRLPRRILVTYPRLREDIFHDYKEAEAFLIAELNHQPVGYCKVQGEIESKVGRVVDLVVSAPMRRQGIASGLIVAIMELLSQRGYQTLILEMQSKNDPAIKMATKLGFIFCGFREHYFPNQEPALFFSRFIR
ncbi:MAG: GNAT family N-acetyltransferase [Anaerolineales bacterium]